jgi:hypothetical protein
MEAKGSWLEQLNRAVLLSERRVESLLNHYYNVVIDELSQIRYGQRINFASLGSEAKRDLRLHVRVSRLKQFNLGRRGDFDQITPEYLYARAEKAAATLNALRAYIAKDQGVIPSNGLTVIHRVHGISPHDRRPGVRRGRGPQCAPGLFVSARIKSVDDKLRHLRNL